MTQQPQASFDNPFRPGAGHMPPYLAGREAEREEFAKLLQQKVILQNLILTGLRGLGKTVLLETFKPMAIKAGWLWAGTDLSETTSISEVNLAIRLLTDLAVVTSSLVIAETSRQTTGYVPETVTTPITMNYQTLVSVFENAPGLTSDKLKTVLEMVWTHLQESGKRGIVFAYDEAQNLADHAEKDQYPLSMLLDVFQSIQRKGIPFMLALTGLPTLFPKLVEARTYSERMFHVIFLNPLTREETKQAINKPVEDNQCPISFTEETFGMIWDITRGYPYFVQYVCRECYDVWTQNLNSGRPPVGIPIRELVGKLDTDFFAGRWARATDRQRVLMGIIAELDTAESEFTVQEITGHAANKVLESPFSSSHISQMLGSLSEAGLVYKNRHGKYSFAVPLLAAFIKRQRKAP